MLVAVLVGKLGVLSCEYELANQFTWFAFFHFHSHIHVFQQVIRNRMGQSFQVLALLVLYVICQLVITRLGFL